MSKLKHANGNNPLDEQQKLNMIKELDRWANVAV